MMETRSGAQWSDQWCQSSGCPSPGSLAALSRNKVAFVVLVGLAALHIFAWSDYPPDADPVNFVLALDHYDIARERPHAPGYPLYVGMAKLASDVVGRAHGYQLVNMLLLTGTSVGVYLLLKRHVGRDVSVGAAVVFATHPLCWAATVVPESYITDAFYFVLALMLANNAPRMRVSMVLGLALALVTVVAMTRAVSSALLLPLLLFGVARANGKSYPIHAVTGAGLSVILIAAAYLLTAFLAGGMDIYKGATDRVMGNSFRSQSIIAGAPSGTHLWMIAKLYAWLAAIYLPAGLIAGWMIIRGKLKPAGPATRHGTWCILLGVGPFLMLYTLIYYLKPTYLVVFVVVSSIAIAWLLRNSANGQRRFALHPVCAILSLANMFLFWCPASSLPDPLYRLTHSYVRDQDRRTDELAHVLAEQVDDETFVAVEQMPDYLSGYIMRLLVGDGHFGICLADDDRIVIGEGTWGPAVEKSDLTARGFSKVLHLNGTVGTLEHLVPAGAAKRDRAEDPTGEGGM